MPLFAVVFGLLAVLGSGLVKVDVKNHEVSLHKEVLKQGQPIYKVNN